MTLPECYLALQDARWIFFVLGGIASGAIVSVWIVAYYHVRYGPEIDEVKEWRASMRRTRRHE